MKKLLYPVLSSLMIAALAFCGSGCSKKAREARAYEKADKYFAAGDYDNAEKEYMNVLKLDRSAARASGQLGVMALEDGQLARGYFFLKRAVDVDSNNLDLRIKLGTLYTIGSMMKDAREQALYVLERRPDDADATMLLADAAVTLNDDDMVRRRLQKLTVPPAKRAPIDTALGELYLREREMKLAEAAFARARNEDPKFGPLYNMLGSYYWMQKDLKHAEEAFKFSADTAPLRSPRRVKYAQFKVENGDLEGGKRVLQEIMEKTPDYLPATIALAEIAAGETKYDEANRLAAKALARDPNNYDALLLTARVGMMQGEPLKAAAQLEKIAKANSKSPQVYYQLALAYNAANDSTKTMENLNRALMLNTNYVDADLALAQLKLNKGDMSSAIVTLKQLVQRHPQLSEPQLLLGEAYTQQGDLASAELVYRQMETSFPKDVQAPTLRGLILLRLGRKDEAGKEFERSLQLAPAAVTALEQLTDIDSGEGHFDRALERIRKAMLADTNAPEPALLMARLDILQHQHEKAIAEMQKAIVAHPDYSPAYLMLGNFYSETGQPQKALEITHQLLAKHPDDSGAWMQIAMIMDSQRDVAGAEEAYEKALKLSPKNGSALNNLAYLYAEHGHVEKGLEMARRARELQPYDPATADTLGWVLYRKGDYAQASVLLQESVKSLSTSPDVQYHLGMTHYMLGEEDDARASLQYAVQSKQAFSGKDEAALALSILAIDPKTAGPDARSTLEKRLTDQSGDPIALGRLADIYKQEGGTDKAIATYEAAIKANPKNVRALVALAQIYSTRPNQAEKAFALAKEAYKLSPDDAGVTRILGSLAYRSGEYKWSLSLLQETAKKRPADPELTYDLAESSYSLGMVADAVTDARSAMQSGAAFSRAAEAKRFLDLVALAANPVQAVAASAQVDQILKTDPDYVPALMVSGIIAEQKSDAHAATETFEKVLSRYPDFVPAKRHLAILYGTSSIDDKHSAEVAFKAYEAYPNDAEVIKALGTINYRLGDYGKAARFLKEAEAKRSGDAQLEYFLGLTQYQLKQKSDSKKTLLRAIDLKLPEAQAANAKKVLAELK